METKITRFFSDAAGDWVAQLACNHTQHMRHNPPWTERVWVTTPQGRENELNSTIDCPLCDRIEMPAGAAEYKRTAVFTEQTLPTALRNDHRTKAGTWARIVVEQGHLEYHVRGRVHLLSPGQVGTVEPEQPHHVVPLGPLRVHVEFWRV